MSTPMSSRPLMHWIAPTAILAVVVLMIVPMPPLLLDLLLSIDIGLAVVLLLTAIYVKDAVEFSVFPSLLLVLTLLRLALNVAGTRLILLNGADGVEAAGHVIMAFGQFVVGGNFVVGIAGQETRVARRAPHPKRRLELDQIHQRAFFKQRRRLSRQQLVFQFRQLGQRR